MFEDHNHLGLTLAGNYSAGQLEARGVARTRKPLMVDYAVCIEWLALKT